MDRRIIIRIALPLLVMVLSAYFWWKQRPAPESVAKNKTLVQEPRLLEAFRELPDALAQAAQIGPTGHENICFSRAYTLLDLQLGLPHGSVARDLPVVAREKLRAPGTGPMDRARAFLVERKFDEAEAAALQARDAALKKGGEGTRDAVLALELAGLAAEKAWHGGRFTYPKALEHYQAATALTGRERDFLEWVRVQNDLGRVLDRLGREQESEALLAAALKEAESTRPPFAEQPLLLRTRCLLANTQLYLKKFAESEKNCRTVLAVNERVLGLEHPVTLESRLALGAVLAWSEDRREEADRIRHEVYEARKRVLGPDHVDTLLSRMTEAKILRRRGRDDEGAAEYRAVAEARDRTVGPLAPESRFAWSTLSHDYYDRGKFAECEAIERAQMQSQERGLKFGHHDTLNSCYTLILALQRQNKLDEARALAQRAVVAAKQFLAEKDSLRTKIVEVAEELEDRRT